MLNNNHILSNKQRIDDEVSIYLSSRSTDKISATHQTPNDSIYLTFDLPVEAVDRLRFLINRNENILKELGILSVQFDNDYPITIFEESEALNDQSSKSFVISSQNDKHSTSLAINKITSSNGFQSTTQQPISQTCNNMPNKKKTRKTISELTSHVNTTTESVINPAFLSNNIINQQTHHVDDANNFDTNKLQNSADSKSNQKKKKRAVKLNDVSSDLSVDPNIPKKEKETKTENISANNTLLNNTNISGFQITANQFTMPSPMLATLLDNNPNNPAIISNSSNLDLQTSDSNLKLNTPGMSSSIQVESKTNEANDLMKSDEYKHIYQIRQILANQAAMQHSQEYKDSNNPIFTESKDSQMNNFSLANKRPRTGSSEFESCENSKRLKKNEQINNTNANNTVANELQIESSSIKNENSETLRDNNVNTFQMQSRNENKTDFNQTNIIPNEATSNSAIASSCDLKISNSFNQPCGSMRTLPLNIFDNDTSTSSLTVENKSIERILTIENSATNNNIEHSTSVNQI